MRNIITIIFGSVLIGFAYNFLLIPHKILSGGLSGIAMMLGIITPLNTGLLYFVLNLPLLIIGYFKLGKRFIGYTILSVIVLSTSLYIIPVYELSNDPILASLFGGVIAGVGVGIIFRASGSSGGFDIIGMLLTKKRDFPLGSVISGMNAIVIIISGFVFSWDAALLTLVSIYATGKAIDLIHTNNLKLTVMIVTSKGDDMKDKLFSKLYRGITIMNGQGAYTGEERKILITVITRYQLSEVKNTIREVDPHAFVNITETKQVIGSFNRG
ncbi:YitT family protein [Rummeliibacillus sp. TYF005]|uniref:YitT family protein n=1 Tax=Rummeliibacillus sp. TYF005 TaxID=2058214 RepID=UPI000F539FA7|nr:YitT family protein [Rummeliibacillus sp. TYF005]RPJ95607.1 YitT family protein [Rummeliibacillus sp. TYF005]